MAEKYSENHVEKIKAQLIKAIKRLELSSAKIPVKENALKVDEYTDEDLAQIEAWMSRFARLTDIFMNQFLRTLILQGDPAFRGTLKDILNVSEKLGFIDSAREWYQIRELRNRQAHEYEEEDLIGLFFEMKKHYDRVTKIKLENLKGPC